MFRSTLLQTFFIAIIGTAAHAQDLPRWLPSPPTNPLTFGSSRLDTGFGNSTSEGEWSVSLAVSQFNVWNYSDELLEIRGEREGRQALSEEDFTRATEQWPDRELWFLDVEGSRADLFVSRGLSERLSLSIQVPVISIGAPRWDRLAENYHDLLGLDSHDRDRFPRGDTRLFLSSGEEVLLGGPELEGDAIGDLTVALGWDAGELLRGDHRVVLVLDAPTGDDRSFYGSGGWEGGVDWFGYWKVGPRIYKAAAGYRWLGDGDLLGAQRSDTWHALFQFERELLERIRLSAGVRVDSSPLDAIFSGAPGEPSTYYRFGLAAELGGRWWGAFHLGEEIEPVTGVESDWSFQLSAGWKQRAQRDE